MTNKSGTLYVGMTNNLERRILEHKEIGWRKRDVSWGSGNWLFGVGDFWQERAKVELRLAIKFYDEYLLEHKGESTVKERKKQAHILCKSLTPDFTGSSGGGGSSSSGYF